MIKIYEYSKCSTCKKALQYLNTKGILYKKFDIVENPPTLDELKKMLQFLKASGGGLKNLFNTSGVQYRELNISEKLKNGLTEREALQLLAENGKLIKRPFLLSTQMGHVGFKSEDWDQFIKRLVL